MVEISLILKLPAFTGLTHSLQNDISNKEALLRKNAKLIDDLQKQVNISEQKISALSSRVRRSIGANLYFN